MSNALRLSAVALVAVGGFANCTFHHSVPIRYTPMIQSKRLADAGAPQVMQVGEFKDGRTAQQIGQERVNPISVHKVRFQTIGDVPTVVRSAFLDGLLKSGFNVPAEGDAAAPPLYTVTGRVTTYTVDTKTGWSKVTVAADVAVELTFTDRAGTATIIPARGAATAEGKSLGIDAAYSDTLDRALQDCVKNFLADAKFLDLIQKSSAPAARE